MTDIRQTLEENGISLEQFIERVCENAAGNPLMSDCVSYAVALSEFFESEGVYCVFLPTEEKAVGSMHATVSIDGDLYDARGNISRGRLHNEQSKILMSDFGDWYNKNTIRESPIVHVDEEARLLSPEEAKNLSNFDGSIYNAVLDYCHSEEKKINGSGELSDSASESRGPDF